jgi:hypothetical protein
MLPGHMASPACHVPRAGPGQWSPPPFPHQVCQGQEGPGQPVQTRDRPWWRVAGRPYLWITDAESFSRFRRFLSA